MTRNTTTPSPNTVQLQPCQEEEEEPEPVSGTLILRVISEPASPSVSRKPSVRGRDQPPAFLTDSDRGEQFLQVQVQRSSSSSSISGQRSPDTTPIGPDQERYCLLIGPDQ